MGLGHRRIALVGGDPDMAVTQQRCAGYRKAMTDAKLPILPEWIQFGYFAEDGGYGAAKQMMQVGDQAPTAYYAANDLMAMGVMRRLRELGAGIPSDVTVVDTNDSYAAVHVEPALTSLRVPYAKMAREAIQALIDRIDGVVQEKIQGVVSCELIIRSSSGPAPRTRV